jgi:DnaJ-class molecular chaperone
MTLYNTLGVDKHASKNDIKKAYRNKAKKHHPDKEGGDNKKMTEITRAYSILSDDEKREYYDSTGKESNNSFEQRFMGLVSQMFSQIIDHNDVDYTDLIGEFKNKIIMQLNNFSKTKIEYEDKLKKLENVKKRIKSNTDNTIGLFLDEHISQSKNALKLIENDEIFLNKSYDMLELYEYQFDKHEESENSDHVFWNSISINL